MGVMRTGADVVRVKEGGEPASRAAGQQHLLGAVQPVLRTRGCELSEGSKPLAASRGTHRRHQGVQQRVQHPLAPEVERGAGLCVWRVGVAFFGGHREGWSAGWMNTATAGHFSGTLALPEKDAPSQYQSTTRLAL